jgi:hypothetical protein
LAAELVCVEHHVGEQVLDFVEVVGERLELGHDLGLLGIRQCALKQKKMKLVKWQLPDNEIPLGKVKMTMLSILTVVTS